MDLSEITSVIVEVIEDIQSASGGTVSSITGGTCPLRDCQDFDSLVCTEAMTALSIELDIDIPDNVNVFVSENGKERDVNEIANAIYIDFVSRENNV